MPLLHLCAVGACTSKWQLTVYGFPCSVLACYCAIAVLCCIAVLLVFLKYMSCCGDSMQYDKTAKPKEMRWCVILHTHSSCRIYDSAREKRVSRECEVEGLTPALLLHFMQVP